MLQVPSIKVNLISIILLRKVGVKVSSESDKIVMTKNNVFMGKGYCDQDLLVHNIQKLLMNLLLLISLIRMICGMQD